MTSSVQLIYLLDYSPLISGTRINCDLKSPTSVGDLCNYFEGLTSEVGDLRHICYCYASILVSGSIILTGIGVKLTDDASRGLSWLKLSSV